VLVLDVASHVELPRDTWTDLAITLRDGRIVVILPAKPQAGRARPRRWISMPACSC
jgi:hypothetical protein